MSRASEFGPAVSVVVPLYNKAGTVERAVRSILAQTESDFELIVVNDGSSDGSDLIARDIDDQRIRVVDQPNAGEAAARNRGIAEGVGRLVAFCDADDEWRPCFLRTVLSLRRSHPRCHVFATAYVLAEPDGHLRRLVLRDLPERRPWSGVIDYYSVAASSDSPFCSSSIAVTRDAIRAVDGFPVGVQVGADFLTWARLAARFEFAYCTVPCAVFHLRGKFPAKPVRHPDMPDSVGRELAGIMSTMPNARRGTFRRFAATWHRTRATMFLRLGDRSQAVGEIRKMARYERFSLRLCALAVLALTPRIAGQAAFSGAAWFKRSRR